MGLRSIDSPRGRPAPTTAILTSSDGLEQTISLLPRTLIVAVKPDCDGCALFIDSPAVNFADWRLLLISREPIATSDAQLPVFVAPDLFAELEISSAPFYVALDGNPVEVVLEGVVFAPEQVASELLSL